MLSISPYFIYSAIWLSLLLYVPRCACVICDYILLAVFPIPWIKCYYIIVIAVPTDIHTICMLMTYEILFVCFNWLLYTHIHTNSITLQLILLLLLWCWANKKATRSPKKKLDSFFLFFFSIIQSRLSFSIRMTSSCVVRHCVHCAPARSTIACADGRLLIASPPQWATHTRTNRHLGIVWRQFFFDSFAIVTVSTRIYSFNAIGLDLYT